MNINENKYYIGKIGIMVYEIDLFNRYKMTAI